MASADGKVAIVTGGAAGIGRAAAFMLAKEGAQVAVVDIVDTTGQQTVAEIDARGGTDHRRGIYHCINRCAAMKKYSGVTNG